MKTSKEFKEFYRQTLLPKLKKLDRVRKNTLLVLLSILSCWLIFIAIFVLYLIYGNDRLYWWLPAIAVIGGGVAFYHAHGNKYGAYYADYKAAIIKTIVAFIDDRLGYYPDNCIPEDEFNDSNIFNMSPDWYEGSDYVSGMMDQTEIRFSQIHAQYKTETTYTDDDDNTRTDEHWHTIFKGIFFIADFNKDFSSQTLVWPDTTGNFIRLFTKKRSFFSGWQTIKLEDPEFDRYFIVYGSDQIESRYVLSTSLARRILNFRKKADTDIYISFLGSKVYVAIPCGTLFEPALFRSLVDYRKAYTYFLYLQLAAGIVEDFDLNTRIWSKQPSLKVL